MAGGAAALRRARRTAARYAKRRDTSEGAWDDKRTCWRYAWRGVGVSTPGAWGVVSLGWGKSGTPQRSRGKAVEGEGVKDVAPRFLPPP
jgi:hypothetical protein